jgi:hypothetical protein
MWKTGLTNKKHYLYASTGGVENLWKIILPVEILDKKTLFPQFPQALF